MTDLISVSLVGAGSMGGALLHGWLSDQTIDAASSAVFDPAASDEMIGLSKEHGFMLNPDAANVQSDALVLAIKPQMAEKVLPTFSLIAERAIVISVMAGKSIAAIQASLGGQAKVVRAMPNLPAAIGKGAAGLYAPKALNDRDRDVAEQLLQSTGEVVWVETEEAVDAVTAVSGSGPAYFFLLTEALAEAGATLGLDQAAAMKLARATLIGAGALLEVEERSAAQMRAAVTSPGGTTEAALGVLDGDEKALRNLMRKAVAAATKRAGELTD